MATEKKLPPNKPDVRRLGTICCNNLVETTPIVFKGELYRFEVVRRKSFNSEIADKVYWRDLPDLPCLRFVHIRTNTPTPYFAEGHTFGSPYVEGDTMYAVTCVGNDWGSDRLAIFKSNDLITWEKHCEIHLPGFRIFNMCIAKKDGTYKLLIEINGPKEECAGNKWVLRFLTSTDFKNWELMPIDYHVAVGSPGLYTFEDDPYYYLIYTQWLPNHHFDPCVARTLDLKEWEFSKVNPIFTYNDDEDKKIGNPFLSLADRERIKYALNINNSDLEICEYLGRTIIYYSWGDQKGNEFLAEACAECGMHKFLKSFFESAEE